MEDKEKELEVYKAILVIGIFLVVALLIGEYVEKMYIESTAECKKIFPAKEYNLKLVKLIDEDILSCCAENKRLGTEEECEVIKK